MKIAVAGIGYVGLSNAILLAQHNEVTAVDVFQEKADMINNRKSPIIDSEIELEGPDGCEEEILDLMSKLDLDKSMIMGSIDMTST